MVRRRAVLLLPVALAAVTLPGCVFSVGGGSHPRSAEAASLSELERSQVELAEAYTRLPASEDRRDGLVLLASNPALTGVARRHVIVLTKRLVSSADRRAVLDALARTGLPTAQDARPL